jgi:outer membrane protein assembly factor BamB
LQGIHAYTIDHLQEKWTALTDRHTLEPVVHGQKLYVGSSRGLYSLDTRTGDVLWSTKSDQMIYTPTLANGVAYAGSQRGVLYAFDAHSGRELWSTELPGWVYSPAVFKHLVITGGQDATLWALDRTNGSRRWSQALTGELVFNTVPGSPGTVLTTTFAGDLIAFETAQGQARWQLHTPSASHTPFVSGDTLLLSGFDGSLRSVNPHSGAVIWKTQLSGRLSTPRLIDQDRLLVGNDMGEKYFLNAHSGAVIEVRATPVAGAAVGDPFQHAGGIAQFVEVSGKLRPVVIPE